MQLAMVSNRIQQKITGRYQIMSCLFFGFDILVLWAPKEPQTPLRAFLIFGRIFSIRNHHVMDDCCFFGWALTFCHSLQ